MGCTDKFMAASDDSCRPSSGRQTTIGAAKVGVSADGKVATCPEDVFPVSFSSEAPDGIPARCGTPDIHGTKVRRTLRAGGVVLRVGFKEAPEVLLVSRRRAVDSFTVPAGKFQSDTDNGSFEACAQRETREEAGIEGKILWDLGWYTSRTKDGRQADTRFFAMTVEKELPDWEEKSERSRCWYRLDEARCLLEHSQHLVQAFEKAQQYVDERMSRGVPPVFSHTLSRVTSTPSIASDDSDSMFQLMATRDRSEEGQPEFPEVDSPKAASRSSQSLSRASNRRSLSSEDFTSASVDGDATRSLASAPGRSKDVRAPRVSPASTCRDLRGSSFRAEDGNCEITMTGFFEPERTHAVEETRSRCSTAGLCSDMVVLDVGASPLLRKEQSDASLARRNSNTAIAKHIDMEDMEGERFRFYGKQVGGHFCLVKPVPESKRIAIKPHKSQEGTEHEVPSQQVVLKPLVKHEYGFYKMIHDQAPSLKGHVAHLFGTKTLTQSQVKDMTSEVDRLVREAEAGHRVLETRMRSHEFQTYIVLEDLASAMQKPCILDLKMGYKQRSKNYNEAKRLRVHEKSQGSTSHLLGFRLCGLDKESDFHDKYWGRALSHEVILDELGGFFVHGQASAEQRRRLILELRRRLKSLRETISVLPHWRFWNTSLLFLYDGANLDSMPDMRMIDFAHCTCVREASPDVEFVAALSNVEVFLQAVQEGHSYSPWISERLAMPPADSSQDREELEDAQQDDDELESLSVGRACSQDGFFA